MLNKFFFICSLAMTGFAALQADEEVPPASFKFAEEEQQELACDGCGKPGLKDLTPGALVCNGSEDRCLNEEGQQETSTSSQLFAVFCEDNQDEQNLLACDGCK